jgi:cytochrome c553
MGELKAMNSSRPLNSLSLEDFQIAIRDYGLDQYDRGMAFVMKPYASMLIDKDIKAVYEYIKRINNKK